ncbi:MAG: ABC transporter ATP-binding protein, partial [Bacteroidaceae bacterium]|nr:ABC transporter ATP-binding protein [Bacteroidaceae bacterium]
SGMMVRLGFAVAAHLDPEILVVDEVLAVGDAEFQKKAIGKMQDVSRGEGRTVLFVSHNMGSVRQLCKTGLLLKNGRMEYSGEINDVVNYYLNDAVPELVSHVDITNAMRDLNRSLEVQFLSADFLKKNPVYAMDEDVVVRVKIRAFRNVAECRINFSIQNRESVVLGTHSSRTFFSIKKGEEKTIELTIHTPQLALGTYSLSFSVGTGNMLMGETNFDVVAKVLSFDIDRLKQSGTEDAFFSKWLPSWGNLYIDAQTKVIE